MLVVIILVAVIIVFIRLIARTPKADAYVSVKSRQTLEKYDEDVVVCMYGDHIPGLGLSDESYNVKGRTIYDTEYVIWDNFGLKKTT